MLSQLESLTVRNLPTMFFILPVIAKKEPFKPLNNKTR